MQVDGMSLAADTVHGGAEAGDTSAHVEVRECLSEYHRRLGLEEPLGGGIPGDDVIGGVENEHGLAKRGEKRSERDFAIGGGVTRAWPRWQRCHRLGRDRAHDRIPAAGGAASRATLRVLDVGDDERDGGSDLAHLSVRPPPVSGEAVEAECFSATFEQEPREALS